MTLLSKRHRMLFDVTGEVRATGWSLDDPKKLSTVLKSKLLSRTLPAVFNKHFEERKYLTARANLQVRVIVQRQLQGGLRFLFLYSYDRESNAT